jgi:hypothetical protein
MAPLAEGIWPCTVLSGSFGANDKGIPRVQINVRFDDGPSSGRLGTYEDEVTAKSAPYVARSLRACGWTGDDLRTVKADIAAWIIATGGKSTAEVKHLEIRNGKRAGQIWDKINSIGRGPRVLKEAAAADVADANQAMARALAELGAGGGPDDVPPPGDDDMPFASASLARDVTPIARVLR